MKIRFIKFNKDVEIPARKHFSDTGADIKMVYAGTCPAHSTTTVPLGFGIEIPNGHTARLQVRTSLAKRGLFIQGCAIDAGYVGEITMILHNISDEDVSWDVGDRLGYIEVYPVQYPEFVEDLGEERGNGAFGSTGK